MRQIMKVVTLALAASIVVACGQNAIHITPPVADAKNFSGGVVPFTANGVSSPTWCIGTTGGICNGNIPSIATIDSSGHAKCLKSIQGQSQSGTVTVLAGRGTAIEIPDKGEQLSAFGAAQLTCP
jgi:hypothetical protein